MPCPQIVEQISEVLTDPDDRDDPPTGAYLWYGETMDDVLVDFHETEPIGGLDDFDIKVYPIRDSNDSAG